MYSFIRKLSLIIAVLFVVSPVFAADFSFETTGFLDENMIPVVYTCDGKDISPELSWANPPKNTKSFAIILTDPTAPNETFYHWVLYNIPATTSKLEEGISKLPSGAKLAKNGWGKKEYNGPCPPKGTAHSYIYTIYALDTNLNVPENADGKAVEKAMENHILGTQKLTAVYSRWLV